MSRPKRNLRRISALLPQDMFDLLARKAKDNDLTMTQILRVAVRELYKGEI
jgi:hypothetical protein